jgi:hypothetical protein
MREKKVFSFEGTSGNSPIFLPPTIVGPFNQMKMPHDDDGRKKITLTVGTLSNIALDFIPLLLYLFLLLLHTN